MIRKKPGCRSRRRIQIVVQRVGNGNHQVLRSDGRIELPGERCRPVRTGFPIAFHRISASGLDELKQSMRIRSIAEGYADFYTVRQDLSDGIALIVPRDKRDFYI